MRHASANVSTFIQSHIWASHDCDVGAAALNLGTTCACAQQQLCGEKYVETLLSWRVRAGQSIPRTNQGNSVNRLALQQPCIVPSDSMFGPIAARNAATPRTIYRRLSRQVVTRHAPPSRALHPREPRNSAGCGGVMNSGKSDTLATANVARKLGTTTTFGSRSFGAPAQIEPCESPHKTAPTNSA